MTQRKRPLAARRTALGLAAGLSAALVLSACGAGNNPLSNSTGGGTASGSSAPLVIGSADFPESQIIAEIYAGALAAAGIETSTKPAIGSREIYLKAIEDGSIDVIPEYTGNLLAFIDESNTVVEPDQVVEALPEKLPEGLTILEASNAEDKDAMVVTQATAEKYQLKSIEDLAKVCDQLTLGAPPEFRERPYGLAGLKKHYNCVPKKFEPIADGGGPVTLKALLSDQIQVADIFTTAPSIADNNLVVLEDPKNNWLAQQVVPLVREDKVKDDAVKVLNEVSGKLTTEHLIELNRAVSGDEKQDPKDAAADWLKENGFTQ